MGRGTFKRGQKVLSEGSLWYDFGCNDSLEEHATDTEENSTARSQVQPPIDSNPAAVRHLTSGATNHVAFSCFESSVILAGS